MKCKEPGRNPTFYSLPGGVDDFAVSSQIKAILSSFGIYQ
jgi:hypothetical protein